MAWADTTRLALCRFFSASVSDAEAGGSGADAGSQSPGVGPLASISPGGSGHTHRF